MLAIVAISYSWLRTAAVIKPPKVAAPLNVTKSPLAAPWDESVTVNVVDPLVAANVKSPAEVVVLNGVTSVKESPNIVINGKEISVIDWASEIRDNEIFSSNNTNSFTDNVFIFRYKPFL